jgi:hypothetical protein
MDSRFRVDLIAATPNPSTVRLCGDAPGLQRGLRGLRSRAMAG